MLFSGGLDSTTTLHYAIERHQKNKIYVIIFDYGQRHSKEKDVAHAYLKDLNFDLSQIFEIQLKLPFTSSSLINRDLKLPDSPLEKIGLEEIPNTFVPGRNIIFLSIAAGKLYELASKDENFPAIYFGANFIDYSGYPDCRPEFIEQMEKAITQGLDRSIKIIAPYLKSTKAEIIKDGMRMGVKYEKTWSCYFGNEKPCLKCDSCKLRIKAFHDAKIIDPLIPDEKWEETLKKIEIKT